MLTHCNNRNKARDWLKRLSDLHSEVTNNHTTGPLGYLLQMAIEDVSLSLNATSEPSPKMQNLVEFISIESEGEADISWWLQQICIRYKMSPNNLFRPTRGIKKFIEPKAVFTYGLVTFYSKTLKEAGELMGRDRTTSAYHERNITDLRDQDADLDAWLSDIENRVYIARSDTPFTKVQKRLQVKLSQAPMQK